MIFSFSVVAGVFNFTMGTINSFKVHSIVHFTLSIVHLSRGIVWWGIWIVFYQGYRSFGW